MNDYDSRLETIQHSRRVDELLLQIIGGLQERIGKHDFSKTEDPELATFNEFTPKLKDLTYGTPGYQACLDAMRPALVHHYANNRHHPEHFEEGVRGMTLVDVVEMLCDWKAATERSDTGDLRKSLDIQRDRFELGETLWRVLANTSAEFGWMS